MNLISSAYDTTLMAIVILLFGQLERPKKVIPKNAPDQYHRNTEITENEFTPTQSDLKNVFVRCGGDESFLYTVLRPGRNKIFSLITARRFRPGLLRTAAGLCLCAGRSRPLPAAR